MNYLYINSQHITTLQGLRECFLQEEAQRLNSYLFNELKNLFLDGDIENFLRTIGEETLAEKVKGIEIGSSDSEIMRQLVTIITGMEPILDFDFRSCLEVLETTVKGNKAIFKLRVLKRVNEKPVTICIMQPVLLLEAMRKNNTQNQPLQDKILHQYKIGEWSEISEAINTSLGLLAFSYVFRVDSLKKYDSDLLRKVSGCLNFKSIDLSRYRHNDIIEFETDIDSDYGVLFFVGKEKVGEVSAETIAYSNYCESYDGSTKYDSERIKLISENAKKGWARFQNLLGDVYRYGHGMDKSYKEAFEWYSESAKKGCASAQCSLGEMYLYGKGVDVDYAEALKWFQKLSDQGNAMGQCWLGFMYEGGKGGVDVDLSKALDLYAVSAAQNNPFGQCLLGRLYERGAGGVTKDINRALELYLNSAIQNDAMGQIYLGLLLERQITVDVVTKKLIIPFESNIRSVLLKRLWHYEEVDNTGMMDFLQLLKIKDLYDCAGRNVDAWEKYNWKNNGNRQEALFPAASMGSALCLMVMGVLSKNAQFLKKAADQDGLFAAFASSYVGVMYENGYLVERNQNMAEWYYNKAIACFGEKETNDYIRKAREDINDWF